MADIELVIKIPEEMYKNIQSRDWKNGGRWFSEEWKAIHNGISLPKGRGRLKDELDLDLFDPSLGTDEYITDLMAKHNIDYVNGDDEDKVRAFAKGLIHGCMNVIKTAPTIVEADKAEGEK